MAEDVVVEIHNTDNTLDGVPWNEGGEETRSFVESFTEVLKTCSLTGRSKLILRQRFLNMYLYYENRHKYMNIFHNGSRVVVTVGSIIIPALLTLDNEISDRSTTSQAIYYATFSLSLIVTVTNSISELMQIGKKYYTYATVKENLVNEGWSFLSLSGKYKHYTDHSECWRKFVNKTEKLNSNAVNSNLILSTQKHDDHHPVLTPQWNELLNQVSDGSSINTGISEDIIYTNN